jgi:hypothetical protein
MNNLSDLVTTFLASCLTLLLILVLNRVRDAAQRGVGMGGVGFLFYTPAAGLCRLIIRIASHS